MPAINNSSDPREIQLYIEALERRHEVLKKEVESRNKKGFAAEEQTIHLKKTKLSLKDKIEFWRRKINQIEIGIG
jgi:hypothetical protein